MKLRLIQNFSTLEDLKPIKELKPLNTIKVTSNIPNTIALLSLSANLLYQAHMIINNQAICKDGLCAKSYTDKAIELMKVLNDYEHKHISLKEFKSIKKEFGLNRLYD